MNTIYDLDVVGVVEGTDKSSSVQSNWDYLRHYQRLFSPFQDESINLIEIGVAGGSSLKVWKSFFKKCHIIGVDIDKHASRFADERVTIELGSQDDPEFLAELCKKYPPTIIIDDGSHRSDHMVYTFERMFPSLLPGGIYIVEDVALHCGPGAQNWKGFGEDLPQDYYLQLARGCLARSLWGANDWGTSRYNMNHIDSIEFLKGAVVLHKTRARDVVAGLAFADQYVADRNVDANVHMRLCEFILKHGGPLERATEEIRSAINIAGETQELMRVYVSVLERQGLLIDAAKVAERAAAEKKDADLWFTAGNLRGRHGDHIGAVGAYRNAMALAPANLSCAIELSYALDRTGNLPEALAVAREGLKTAAGTSYEQRLNARVAEISIKLGA